MKKSTIEIARFNEHPDGYGIMWPPSEHKQLENLVKWSGDNPGTKIYEHKMFHKQENFDKYTEPYISKNDTTIRIPLCDLVFYLDIYYQ